MLPILGPGIRLFGTCSFLDLLKFDITLRPLGPGGLPFRFVYPELEEYAFPRQETDLVTILSPATQQPMDGRGNMRLCP